MFLLLLFQQNSVGLKRDNFYCRYLQISHQPAELLPHKTTGKLQIVFKLFQIEHFFRAMTEDSDQRRLFVCNICEKMMTQKMFMCETGHTLCRNCNARVKQCPYCKRPMTSTRNFDIESILLNHLLSRKKVQEKSELDETISIKCPLPRCDYKARDYDKIVKHINRIHTQNIFQIRTNQSLTIFIENKNSGSKSFRRVVGFHKQIFVVRARVNYDNNKVMVAVDVMSNNTDFQCKVNDRDHVQSVTAYRNFENGHKLETCLHTCSNNKLKIYLSSKRH
jgi:hypothetical protein